MSNQVSAASFRPKAKHFSPTRIVGLNAGHRGTQRPQRKLRQSRARLKNAGEPRNCGIGRGCEKEKGRLLAPSPQSRKETAAEHSPVLPGEADHDKSRWVGPWLASRGLVKRSLTGPHLAATGPDLGSRRDAVPFRTLSKPFHPSVPCIARQAFTCRAAQDSDDWKALAKRL